MRIPIEADRHSERHSGQTPFEIDAHPTATEFVYCFSLFPDTISGRLDIETRLAKEGGPHVTVPNLS